MNGVCTWPARYSAVVGGTQVPLPTRPTHWHQMVLRTPYKAHLAILVGEPLIVSGMTRERHVEVRVGDTGTYLDTRVHGAEPTQLSILIPLRAGVNLKLRYLLYTTFGGKAFPTPSSSC